MKSVICLTVGVLLAASTTSAQAPAGAQKFGLAQGLQRSYDGIKMNLNEAAAKMPDADYKFTPSPDIRTYAGQLAHVAFWHYFFCAAAKGETTPIPGPDAAFEKTKTTKADVVKVLSDSFAYCDPAFAAVSDASAVQLVKVGQNEIARGSMLSNLIAHDNEEYGIITVYLRLKKMVPPSTERAQRGRGGR